MKKLLLPATSVVILCMLFISVSFAQDKKEKEEIIIRKKGNKKEKTVIVIEGDKVTINGKPVEKTDKDVIIQRFNDENEPMIMTLPRPPRMPRGPKIAYNFKQEGDWKNFEKDFQNKMNKDWESHAFLGVVTDENEKGAEIKEVQKETAAEKSGLQKGGIITKVDDADIKDPEDLVEAIQNKKPNDEVTVSVLRNGKEKNLKVKLGETKMSEDLNHFELNIPEIPDFENNDFQFDFMHRGNEEMFNEKQILLHKRPQLGVTIQDTEEGTGVKVLEMDDDSPASKSGLQKADIITEINGKKINSVNEAREALQDKNEKSMWSLKVLRDGKIVNIEVKIPKVLKKADL
jgi:serine protease Do